MGRIRHSAIVVTGSEKADAVFAHAKAAEMGLVVTPVVSGLSNGYYSFMICPDGSKEGWDTSTTQSKLRHEWTAWARQRHQIERHPGEKSSYFCDMSLDWAYVDFGGDDDDVRVVDWCDNDTPDKDPYFC